MSAENKVDCRNRNRGIWLVKVPKYLSKKWQQAAGRPEIGRLKVFQQSGRKGNVDVVFFSKNEVASASSLSSDAMDIPTEHKFITTNVAHQMLAVVTEDKAGLENPDNEIGCLTLEGRVLQKAECRPPPSKKYMEMKINQIENSRKPVKQVITISRAEVKFKPIARHAEDVTQGKRKGEKNVRLDKTALLDLLFQSFEKHQYYKLVDLARVTQQPPNYLKEVLSEIARYNTLPPHKFMWELKPEYRHYRRDEGDAGVETDS